APGGTYRAGGGEHVYEVAPMSRVDGPYEGGWFMYAAMEITWGIVKGRLSEDEAEREVEKAARAYWAGSKCRHEGCNGGTEYLVESARVEREVTTTPGAAEERVSPRPVAREADGRIARADGERIQRGLFDYLSDARAPRDGEWRGSDTPAHLAMRAKRMLPKGTWLVHFTKRPIEKFDRGETLAGGLVVTSGNRGLAPALADCSANLAKSQSLP